MPKKSFFLIGVMLCVVITASACERWDDVTKIFRYKGLYEETLSELNTYKSQLADKEKELSDYKDRLKQAVVKADEYKDNWNQAVTRAEEYKDKWEATKVVAENAHEEVAALQNNVKEFEKMLSSAIIENKKANLMIIGLKLQLEQCADREKKEED